MAERDELQQEMAGLKADLNELREHLATVAQALRDGAQSGSAGAPSEGAGAPEPVADPAECLMERLRQALGEAQARGKRAYAVVEQQVEERPLTSLAAAFGIGLLVGKLLDWRR